MLQDYRCHKVILIQPEEHKRCKTDRRDVAALSELLWVNRDRFLEGNPVRGLRHVTICSSTQQEIRYGLVLGVVMTQANRTAEIAAARALQDRLQARHARSQKTLGTDEGYDSDPYYLDLEKRGVTPHCAVISTSPLQPENVAPCCRSAVFARERIKARLTTVGYQLIQRSRKKTEEYFDWMKAVAGPGRSRWVGRWKQKQQLELTAAAFKLVRIQKLLACPQNRDHSAGQRAPHEPTDLLNGIEVAMKPAASN